MNKIEVLKEILLVDDVQNSIKNNEDIIFDIIPMLKCEKDFDQKSVWHSYDVWNHTIKAICSSAIDFEIRLVLLLHDIGKPFSYQEDGDVRHFKGHALKSAEIAKPILEQLGFEEKLIDEMLWLIGQHATTININDINETNINLYHKLLDVQFCDASAYEENHAIELMEKLKQTSKELQSIFIDSDQIRKLNK